HVLHPQAVVEGGHGLGGVLPGEEFSLPQAGEDGFDALGQAVDGGNHLLLALPQLGAEVGVEGDGQLQGLGPGDKPPGGGEGGFGHGGEDAGDVEPLAAVQVQLVDVVGGQAGGGGALAVVGDVRVALVGG